MHYVGSIKVSNRKEPVVYCPICKKQKDNSNLEHTVNFVQLQKVLVLRNTLKCP